MLFGYDIDNHLGLNVVVAIFAVLATIALAFFIFRSIKKDVFLQHDAKNFDLSEREIDFLRLICDGYDNKEIASKLFLAEGTVRNGVSRLLEKLNLKDRTQLAVFAIKNNII